MKQAGLILAACSGHPLEIYCSWKLDMDLLLIGVMNTKVDVSGMAIVQPTEQPRTSPPGSRGSEHMPLHPS